MAKVERNKFTTKDIFFSTLKNSHISDKDYEHAKKVWSAFNIQNIGEYSDLYLKTDVLLLADVFENFRKTCINTYKLDPLHYYTAPGLSFDAMLKLTKVELELISDVDMILFIERGIRGGIVQCSHRYATANNKYMGEKYSESERDSYIMYFDINNMYGSAMCQPLPHSEFQWMNDTSIDILSIPTDYEYGFILEVDLDYPQHLFESHKDLPFCAEHRIPPNSKLKHTKLMTTFYPKKNYVIHYKMLQLCIQNGLNITKIHRILKFRQSCWLKKYIELNGELRKQATNEFHKNFFKLIINAIFGKTIENVRKYRDIKLVNRWNGRYGAKYYISKPNFHSFQIFDEDLLAIEMTRTKVEFNKPIYVGFSILDISKTFLYDFHYNFISKIYSLESFKLLYTDTDSLIYNFLDKDIYELIKKYIHKFDTSNYEENNIYNIPLENKKKIGLMKDECGGSIISEFVGLRAKLYAYKMLNNSSKKKAKGVVEPTLRNITFEDYRYCLFEHIPVRGDQHIIQSKNHDIYTVKQNKLILSHNDDKRMIYPPPTTSTMPWGLI